LSIATNQPFEPISSANLQVRLAQNDEEMYASQKLRYRVFVEDMGAKPSEQMAKEKRDFDRYDEPCDHLLVLDNDREGDERVVGTYRLLRRAPMQQVGQFYTESEYDVSMIKDQPYEILELGRSCVDKDYRSRAVMQLLWRGIGAYVTAHDIKLMFGCASFHNCDVQAHAMALSYLHHNHMAPEDVRPKALPDLYVDMNIIPAEEVDAKAALSGMPALIKGYLRLGGYVGEGAVLDHEYNTTDVSIVVKTDKITGKYTQRYGA